MKGPITKWNRRGAGWHVPLAAQPTENFLHVPVCAPYITLMVWADDLWVFARSRTELFKMVTEVRETWGQAGLLCRDGCRVWASEKKGEEVECGGWCVRVQESLKILGHDFGASADEDLQMAMARGWRAF